MSRFIIEASILTSHMFLSTWVHSLLRRRFASLFREVKTLVTSCLSLVLNVVSLGQLGLVPLSVTRGFYTRSLFVTLSLNQAVLQKLTFSHVIAKFLAFCGTRNFIMIITRCRQWNIMLRQLLTVHIINPYPTAFPYGNGMVLHFYQQQESSTTKTVHKVINKGLKAYV